jgi:hypothetical protein
MSEQSNEAILRRYLLADVDEVEREKIEELLFSENGFAEELAQAEADLIDDYALNVLSKRDRDLFQQNFVLSHERRQNLLFAQAIDAYLDQEASPSIKAQRRPWQKGFLPFLMTHKGWATATVAAAGILLVLSVLVLLKWFAPNNQFAPMRAQREDMERRLAELNSQTQSSKALPSVELSLQPSDLLRGSGEFQQIEIAKDVRVLNLTFVLPNAQHSNYIVIARKIDGDELFSVNDLSPKPNDVLLRVPVEFLPTDDYQFEVKGIDAPGRSASVAIYNLRVVNLASQP